VAFVGHQRIPDGAIVCHGWRLLGDAGNIAVAFITLAVRSQHFAGEPPPSDDGLRSSGGASLAEVARLAPQRADEIYNEFDFTDPRRRFRSHHRELRRIHSSSSTSPK
jgi:hypothetical protein